jgi:hypothetical protein
MSGNWQMMSVLLPKVAYTGQWTGLAARNQGLQAKAAAAENDVTAINRTPAIRLATSDPDLRISQTPFPACTNLNSAASMQFHGVNCGGHGSLAASPHNPALKEVVS